MKKPILLTIAIVIVVLATVFVLQARAKRLGEEAYRSSDTYQEMQGVMEKSEEITERSEKSIEELEEAEEAEEAYRRVLGNDL